QPLVLRLETLDLPLQFFDLFRLADRRKWLRLIHPKLRYTNAAGLSREKFRRHPVRPLINYVYDFGVASKPAFNSRSTSAGANRAGSYSISTALSPWNT